MAIGWGNMDDVTQHFTSLTFYMELSQRESRRDDEIKLDK